MIKNYFVHETSIIDENVLIGDKSKIWHWSHISEGAEIGSNCILGQNIFVGNHVKIGNNCKIQNNISIYQGVQLEDDVFCGPSMVFTNVINPRSFVDRKNEFKKTLVRKGATIGANATILCGIEIGKYALVGAGSVVLENVKDYAIVVGNPARQTGWISERGQKLDLPVKGEGDYICHSTGEKYILKGSNLTKLQ